MKQIFFKFKAINWILIDQMIVSGSNFLSIILIARMLDINSFGEFSTLWLFILIVNTIFMALIIFPMMTLQPLEEKKETYFHSLNQLQFILLIILSILFLIVVLVYSYFSFDKIDLFVIFSFILVLFFYHLQEFYRKYLLVEKKFVETVKIDIISYFFRVFILGAMYFSLKDNVELAYVFLSFFISYFLSVVYSMKYFHIFTNFNMKDIKITFLKHWQLSKWLLPSGLMQWGSINFYLLSASIILSPTAIGIIRLAQNIIGVLNVFLMALENYLPTKYSEIFSKYGISFLKRYFKKTIFLGLVVFSSFAMILSLFSKHLMILLYGLEYEQYYYVITWYAIIFLFMYLIVPIRGILRTLNKTKIWFNSYLITTVFSLLLFYPLEKYFGLNGVLLGMLLSHMILIFSSLISIKKVLEDFNG